MRKIGEIIEIIKEKKCLKSDIDVARALGMKQAALSNHKQRGTIPFEQLAAFCESENISFDLLVLNRVFDAKLEEIDAMKKLISSLEEKMKK